MSEEIVEFPRFNSTSLDGKSRRSGSDNRMSTKHTKTGSKSPKDTKKVGVQLLLAKRGGDPKNPPRVTVTQFIRLGGQTAVSKAKKPILVTKLEDGKRVTYSFKRLRRGAKPACPAFFVEKLAKERLPPLFIVTDAAGKPFAVAELIDPSASALVVPPKPTPPPRSPQPSGEKGASPKAEPPTPLTGTKTKARKVTKAAAAKAAARKQARRQSTVRMSRFQSGFLAAVADEKLVAYLKAANAEVPLTPELVTMLKDAETRVQARAKALKDTAKPKK